MKKLIFIVFILSLFSSLAIARPILNSADKILGVYWSPKKDAKIEIYKRGGRYFGKFIWTAKPRKDSKNPAESLRSRDLLGVEFLKDFKYADGAYEDGQIYDPESGKTYDCKITFAGNDLKVRGYVGISLFGRTEIFRRVQ